MPKKQPSRAAKKTRSVKSAQKKASSRKAAKIQQKDFVLVSFWKRVRAHAGIFLSRRPHRSFRRTRRRDYVRSLELPGYIAFTHGVTRHIWKYRRIFGGLTIVYAGATAILVGLASQSVFLELTDTLQETSAELFEGGWGNVGKAALLLFSGVSGGFSHQLNEAQQVFSVLLFLMAWLSSVWVLRAHMAGGAPRLRDALYNSGSPIVATVLVSLLLLIQMIPGAIGVVLYASAVSVDLFSSGLLAMVVSLIAGLLVVLSAYLLTSGFFSLIVVTLPGMYPWQAIKTAGDLVVGRRLRILLRLTWALFIIAVGWTIFMLPIIMLSVWIQSTLSWLEWVPFVPIALAFVASASVVFMSTYVYMLYRKVVDDDAKPA